MHAEHHHQAGPRHTSATGNPTTARWSGARRHLALIGSASIGVAVLLSCGSSNPTVDANATATTPVGAGSAKGAGTSIRGGSIPPGSAVADQSAPGTNTSLVGTDTTVAATPGASSTTTVAGAAPTTTKAGAATGSAGASTTVAAANGTGSGSGGGSGATVTTPAGEPATTAVTAAPTTATPTTVPAPTTIVTATTTPLPSVTATPNGGTGIHCMAPAASVSATIVITSTGATQVLAANDGEGEPAPAWPAQPNKISGNLNVHFSCTGANSRTTTITATGPGGTSTPVAVTWTIHHM